MLAKLAEAGAALFGGSSVNDQDNATGEAFNFAGATGKQRTLNGNRYDPKAFEQGDFSGIAECTPEQVEAAKLQRQRLKEAEKNQAAKNREDTGSYRSAKNIAKNEQYHIQQRDQLGLEVRGAVIGTEQHTLEKIIPGLNEQNEAKKLSVAKSKQSQEIDREKYQRRHQHVAELRRMA